ncbi:Uncharacterised protein [uncultured archaeon]|nr:Uncharacterised protein [uncultured archaeon]
MNEITGFWPKLKAWVAEKRTNLDNMLVKLGKVKAALLIVAAWAVYFLVGRFVIGLSAKVVAAVSKAALSVVPALVLAVPYLVLLALILVTAAFVVDVVLKKKA